MSDLYSSLKKYVGKLRNVISELQLVEGELQYILNNKTLIDKVDSEINYPDLNNTKSLITEDPKEILLKEALNEDGKNDIPVEFEDTVDALEMMLNDDEMWGRRKEEHDKYERRKSVEEVKTLRLNNNIEINKSNNLDNLEGCNLQTPIPDNTKLPGESTITPLTRITPDQRQKLLYNMYKEALHDVESLGKAFTVEEKDKLVIEESDKLLQIWIKNN
jgi:hypothetical protein